jgi:hypothetical protein
MSLKRSEAKETAKYSLRLMDGDRVCVTAMLNPMILQLHEFNHGRDFSSLVPEYGRLPFQMFLYDLRLCSTDVNEDYNHQGWVPKTYLQSYDPERHFSTGCFTKYAKGLNQHVVISHKEEKGEHMKSVQLSKMLHGVVDERDQVSFSSENVAASACFNVHPVGPEDSPVLVQASVVIVVDSSYHNNSHNGNGFTSSLVKSFGSFGDVSEEEKVAKIHDDLHTCLTTKSNSGEENNKHNDENSVKKKNKKLARRHRKKRFDENTQEEKKNEKKENTPDKSSCSAPFNQVVHNAKVLTVTSEDIVPSSSSFTALGNTKQKRDEIEFNYEAMQTPPVGEDEGDSSSLLGTLKHYIYYNDEEDYYYYYGHPYYHPHIHCKWSLEFVSGAGICESPHIIHEDSFHAFVIFLATVGIGVGVVFFIVDWKSRALFRK